MDLGLSPSELWTGLRQLLRQQGTRTDCYIRALAFYGDETLGVRLHGYMTTNYNIDQTVRVFDSFYDYDVDIPVGDYDVVNSYFQSVMTTKQAADNFTVSLFRVAQDTNIPPLTLLQTFQASGEQLDLNINMAYYLNSIRSRATLLGVGIPVAPNYYAARNVIQ
jgi:hypothetical protein